MRATRRAVPATEARSIPVTMCLCSRQWSVVSPRWAGLRHGFVDVCPASKRCSHRGWSSSQTEASEPHPLTPRCGPQNHMTEQHGGSRIAIELRLHFHSARYRSDAHVQYTYISVRPYHQYCILPHNGSNPSQRYCYLRRRVGHRQQSTPVRSCSLHAQKAAAASAVPSHAAARTDRAAHRLPDGP